MIEGVGAGLTDVSVEKEGEAVGTNGLVCGLRASEAGSIGKESEVWAKEALGKRGGTGAG